MAEMALGYGSEFQLLRYLGHHRSYLNQKIREVIGEGEISWLDFPVDLKRDSNDGEWKTIECFSEMENFAEIKTKWGRFWPTSGNAHNWDGIFKHNDTWYFVEAKAHLEEANQECEADSLTSIEMITRAFSKTCGSDELAEKWIKSKCYQLANRLAFMHFCKEQGIPAKLLYISFLNGYEKYPKENVTDSSKWDRTWEKEMNTLQLSDELRQYIKMVTIDCHQPAEKEKYWD
ncbi:MAG: hypothetical protein MJZ77_05770 [Bacteroidales bacterium]|nr:hypothetical protein [Bacteroidales bacterium]